MKQAIWLVVVLALFVSGCAAIKQGVEDAKVGMSAPLEEGEVSPKQKAQALASTVSAIPYANLSSPVILLAGPYLFAWLRGRRIRKQSLAKNEKPITGSLGASIGAESLIQHIADVAAGMFEVGPNGSVLKRGWKVALATSLGAVAAPEVADLIHNVAIPFLHNTPPAWLANLFNGTALAVSIGGLAAIEKWLSRVEPLKEKEEKTLVTA